MYTGVLHRENTRDLSGHQHLWVNPLRVKNGEVDLLLGVLSGRRSGPLVRCHLTHLPWPLPGSTHFSLLPGKLQPLPPQAFTHWVSFPALTCSSQKGTVSSHLSDGTCHRAQERCAEAPPRWTVSPAGKAAVISTGTCYCSCQGGHGKH